MNAETVYYMLIINGVSSWMATLALIMAISTVFQRSDWILKSSLALTAFSLATMGTLLLLEGILKYDMRFYAAASGIVLKFGILSTVMWFVTAYYRYGRFCQLEGLTLKLKDIKVIASGIWHDDRKESVYDPPFVPTVKSESASEMKVR